MRPSRYKLSVIIPTYNCLDLIKRHLAYSQEWINLADEIIIVDSRSHDGTIEYIKKTLQHPNCIYIERNPGLYESWNDAIATSKGDWIYISTAGDIIERNHLLRLLNAAIKSKADVVVSPQKFVSENGQPYQGFDYTNADFYQRFNTRTNILLNPTSVWYLAFEKNKPNALLGSCASDLFNGEFLRARPFPTEYGTHGDTAWTLRHSSEMRLCVVTTAGADFCIHSKSSPAQSIDLKKMYSIESDIARKHIPASILEEYLRLTALRTKSKLANQKRRDKWHGSENCPRNRFTYILCFLFYLFLRLKLYFKEEYFRRKFCPEI